MYGKSFIFYILLNTFHISTLHDVQLIYGGLVCPNKGMSVGVLFLSWSCCHGR